MPLEELLALYGYNMPNHLIQQQRQQPGALPVGLPDITLNKVTSLSALLHTDFYH